MNAPSIDDIRVLPCNEFFEFDPMDIDIQHQITEVITVPSPTTGQNDSHSPMVMVSFTELTNNIYII